MNLPDLSHISLPSFDPVDLENVKVMALGAAGCALVLVTLTAWNSWGKPLREKYMSSRKRERDQLDLMATNQVGALEYLIIDGQISPQDMWKLAPKYDHIPGFRTKLRDMLKKFLTKHEEVSKTSKLSELSLETK